MCRPACLVLAFVAALVASLPAAVPILAEDAVSSARALLSAWHEEPARIDRARAGLEAAAAADPTPEVLIELARAWFLTGDFRARGEGERVAAYERGSEVARRAIAAAPRNDRAHLWLALNSGRTAEMRGVMRAVTLVGSIREESETVLRLNPSNVEGLILAASLAAEMPGFLGGDRARAETLFKRALEIEPHQTGGRLELARFYVNARRWGDAQRELQRVLDDTEPTDLPRWTVSERPRARAMLSELYERGRLTAPPTQSP
jgi:tetratricopeptide (TPR) repeat protein